MTIVALRLDGLIKNKTMPRTKRGGRRGNFGAGAPRGRRRNQETSFIPFDGTASPYRNHNGKLAISCIIVLFLPEVVVNNLSQASPYKTKLEILNGTTHSGIQIRGYGIRKSPL